MPFPSSSDSDGARPDSPDLDLDPTLTISTAAEEDAPEEDTQTIEPLAGSPPKDFPVYCDHSEADMDTRGVLPFTLHYRSTQRPGFIVDFENHGEVRKGIWRRLRQLLSCVEDLPTVLFDERPGTYGIPYGAIDLVFNSYDVLKRVKDEMKRIEIETRDGNLSTFKLTWSNNSLHGNIIVFECLRLPLNTIDPRELLEAFQDVAASVGTVLGISKVLTEVQEWGVKREDGSVRGYIQIHPDNLTVPWPELSRRLVTHFKWRGYPHYFSFPGRGHFDQDHCSADYPSKLGQAGQPRDADAEAGASSRSKWARRVTDGSDTAAAATRKQRRSKQ